LIKNSGELEKRWIQYMLKNEYASEIDWVTAVENMKEIAKKLSN